MSLLLLGPGPALNGGCNGPHERPAVAITATLETSPAPPAGGPSAVAISLGLPSEPTGATTSRPAPSTAPVKVARQGPPHHRDNDAERASLQKVRTALMGGDLPAAIDALLSHTR